MSFKIVRANAAVVVSRTTPHENYFGNPYLTACNACYRACDRMEALFQFTLDDIPDGRTGVLRIFLCSAWPYVGVFEVRRNKSAFDPHTVTWETKPETETPGSDFEVDATRAGGYLEVDVSSLLDGVDRTIGFTISARRGFTSCATFFVASCTPALFVQSVPAHGGFHADIRSIFQAVHYGLDGENAAFSPAVDISATERVTVFMENTGNDAIVFSLAISPDSAAFINDPQSVALQPGETGALTPYLFARYLRVIATGPSRIEARATFQMQTRDYKAV